MAVRQSSLHREGVARQRRYLLGESPPGAGEVWPAIRQTHLNPTSFPCGWFPSALVLGLPKGRKGRAERTERAREWPLLERGEERKVAVLEPLEAVYWRRAGRLDRSALQLFQLGRLDWLRKRAGEESDPLEGCRALRFG
jgi:hypothetical protein